MQKLKRLAVGMLIGLGSFIAGTNGKFDKFPHAEITRLQPMNMVMALGILTAVWLMIQVPALLKKGGE